jgi:hypothetical protein
MWIANLRMLKTLDWEDIQKQSHMSAVYSKECLQGGCQSRLLWTKSAGNSQLLEEQSDIIVRIEFFAPESIIAKEQL